MIPHLSHVMTLANSIIGVSVLAMPFCFKQCGIVLATLVLLTSSVLSRLACHFLIKSAVMSRRRNFEFLAFHAFGTTGKFLVELFIIGFLLGTCIAFFVVVGDLGPQIVGKILNKQPEDIRTSVLVTTGIFIVLPLGLLRNIDSLSSVCTATIGFYLCLVIKVICESTRHIFLGDWYDRVMYWRPAGILQCLPIFSMALFCQTQLFEIYEAIPNVCLEKMNQVVRGALNICTVVYLCVGFFGYVAFCTQPFTGNILMSFEPSLTSDIIKMGFVFSVAFSFPLVIFPCRASLNSLLFRRAYTHEPTNNYIPEVRFRCLTLTIVTMALGTGILIPNIEFLLGIVGSTIGVMICLIFPAAFFIAISTKNTNERLIAQAILFFGMWIMVLGTYANIYAMEESSNARLLITTGKPLIDQINDMPFKNMLKEDFSLYQPGKEKPDLPDNKQQIINGNSETLDVRREPPIPVERLILTEKSLVETQNSGGNLADVSFRPLIEKTLSEDTKTLEDGVKKKIAVQASDTKGRQSNDVENAEKNSAASPADSQSKKPMEKEKEKKSIKEVEQQKNENLIDSDAIKKEESELAAAAGDQTADNEAAARHEKLRQTLEKHKIEQREMMQEQKKLLEDIKEQKQEFEKMEKKRLANEQSKNGRMVERNTIVEKMRKDIPERNVTDESKVSRNEQIVSKMENELTNNSTAKRDKVAGITSKVDSEESRGPILNALTNWTSKRNAAKLTPVVVDEVSAGIEAAADKKENKRRVEVDEKSIRMADLPIALQMRNKTNGSSIVEEKLALADVNKSAKENLAIRRDILEQRDLEKREKRDASDDDNVAINDFRGGRIVDNVNATAIEGQGIADAGEQCKRRQDDNFIERDETMKRTDSIETINFPTTTEPISEKTNDYIANQRLTDNSISLNYHNVTQVNLLKLKKRDLKALRREQ